MRTAVVGAGLEGRIWANTSARAACDEMRLRAAGADALRKALAFIAAVLPNLHADDLLRGLSRDAVRGRMSAVDRHQGRPADAVVEAQKWRDRRLMAFLAHKRQAAHDVGE